MGHVSSKEGIPVFPFKSPLFFWMVKAHLGWRLFGWHSCAQPPSHRDTQPAEYHPSRILRGLLVEGWEERMGFWKWETHRGSMQSVGVSVFFLQFFDANRFWWLGGYPKITQGLPVVSKKSKVWRRVSDFHPESVAELVVSGNIAFRMMGSVPFGPFLVKARG